MAVAASETTDKSLEASFQQSRSPVFAKGGMVAAAHPLAVAAGIDALRKGGNAMDAAIATALTTAVVIPAMNGLGGDCFMIHWDNKKKKATAVNGSGIGPRSVDRDWFVSRGYNKMPFYGPPRSPCPAPSGPTSGHRESLQAEPVRAFRPRRPLRRERLSALGQRFENDPGCRDGTG
ncbi:MAG: gamma-glutamyltransferase [Thermomicrobiales bacterium]